MLAPSESDKHHGLFGFDGQPMDFRTPRAWAALLARPMKEQDAADWLKNARLFAYWPCYIKQVNAGRTHRNGFGHRRARFTALIPGYIFIAVRDGCRADPWDIVRQTPGITGYMRDGEGYPAFLSEIDIETIRKIESGENKPINPKTAHKFKAGDKVRFIDDLLGRWPPGVVGRLADDGRISVQVPLLGRVVPISAFPHQIEAM